MKIAIVAPSPVPFTIGGAENLYWGLQNYINEQTSHQCELIKLPSPESSVEELIDSYERFSVLKLDHFDCVISTKYPSWMIQHRNHVCYMLHRLRGLYDTYHFTRLPEKVEWHRSDMREASALAARLKEPGVDNAAIFAACKDFLAKNPHPSILQFPGPFSRWLIRYLDSLGMSPSRVKRYVAISENVKRRRDYFPAGSPVLVRYPPSQLSGFRCEGDDYIFTVSRLDGPKRIALLVEAMRYVKSDIPLLIAGTGPEEQALRRIAGNDSRIRFLGFVNNREVLDYYANALVVPFVPYDEDYGLITIEAMMSGKPVLTLTDSGGPNEFVKDWETGFSVTPDPKAIAEKIDYLCTHRQEAREMGRKARDLVSGITWNRVVEGLLGGAHGDGLRIHPVAGSRRESGKRKKMVVAVTFPIYPPRGGGQSRIYHLYRHFATRYDVEILSLCGCGEDAWDREIAPGLREIRTPVSLVQRRAESRLSQSVGWVPVSDIAATLLIDKTPEYLEKLRSAASDADVIVASHPYLGKYLKESAPGAEFWFEAHNVELSLKQAIFTERLSGSDTLLDAVRDVEGFCWRNATTVFACADADIRKLSELYGEINARKIEVPNGVSLDDVAFVDAAERQRRKTKLELSDKRVALFMGSWHTPNIEAAERIFQFSRQLPNVFFLIIGSVCDAVRGQKIPPNVKLLGVVDDDVKSTLLGTADVALNPMESGSGSNLKMFDYFAAGVPVISTEFGARGIEAKAGEHYWQATIERFADVLRNISSDESIDIAKSARRLVEEKYAWGVIAEEFMERLSPTERKGTAELISGSV